MKRFPLWSWFWIVLGAAYFIVPLISTFIFSLEQKRDEIGFTAYHNAFSDPEFAKTFTFSLELAVLTIIVGIVLIVPTAYWVHLRLPQVRPVIELITLLPFVIPAIILVFGLITVYSKPPLLLTTNKVTTTGLLVGGYLVLSMPYLYRSVDGGLRAMNVRALTEAAQSLGANWFTILFRIILPGLRTALLSGAMLTLAIVVGEVVFATYLGLDTFGPYLWLLGQHRAYEPAALTIVSFGLTWAAMGIIALITSGVSGRQAQIATGH